MRYHKIYLGILFLLSTVLLFTNTCFADLEQREEKPLIMQKLMQKRPPTFKLSTSAAIFAGFDSNVRLAPTDRRGDAFQEFLFSANFDKRLIKDIIFSFDYDLDYLNYSAVTDATNLLNHFKFELHKKISSVILGTGYNFHYFYYPHDNSGDFLMNSPYCYVRQNLTKNTYHQLLYEWLYKNHTSRKALDDTMDTYQDKELVDQRQGIEYSIGSNLRPNLFLKFRAKFSINDSNARYLDFYDYKTYDFSPSVNYKLTKAIELYSNFLYTKKDYKSRLVTDRDYKEKDNIYSTSTGVRFKPNKDNILSIFYTYREDQSNDRIQSYVENVISCGWQYNF